LAGLHSGTRWHDPEAVAEAMPDLLRTVDFLVALGGENLVVSGGGAREGMQAGDYRQLAQALNDMGRHCSGRGVRLHYHNHGWEIERDCEVLRWICELSEPRLVSLALDLGHVVKPGGGDPEKVLRATLDRVGYLHLKDVEGDEFVPVGRGCIDFSVLLDMLRGADFDGWAVVENEVELAQITALECITISRQYVRDVLRR
jgi:inosose dehydratase